MHQLKIFQPPTPAGLALAVAELQDDVPAAPVPPMSAELQRIIDTPLPKLRNASLRRESRTEIAKQIRKLFRDLGIKGVSVTAPNYSMAQAVHIRTPARAEHDTTAAGPYWDETYFGHSFRDCPTCQQSQRAQAHIEAIILAAFPDLDNRSDSQSDYFNYRLSISSS